MRSDPLDQFALVWLLRHDGGVAIVQGLGRFFDVEPEIGLALVLVRPVAVVADVRENGSDVAVEFDGSGRGAVSGRRCGARNARWTVKRRVVEQTNRIRSSPGVSASGVGV